MIRFITGIDTNIGKTYITGLIAKFLKNKGNEVITQKLAQTGCVEVSEDIELHRKIMGIALTSYDKDYTTCPYIFKFPASPHLSANLENVEINPEKISNATQKLVDNFEHVLVEGVGGIHVPLNNEISLLDYLEEKKYPLILVSSPKLGSINHTLLTLEVAKNRGLDIRGIVYNNCIEEEELIAKDSINVFKKYLVKYGFNPIVIEVPKIEDENYPEIDFSDLL